MHVALQREAGNISAGTCCIDQDVACAGGCRRHATAEQQGNKDDALSTGLAGADRVMLELGEIPVERSLALGSAR